MAYQVYNWTASFIWKQYRWKCAKECLFKNKKTDAFNQRVDFSGIFTQWLEYNFSNALDDWKGCLSKSSFEAASHPLHQPPILCLKGALGVEMSKTFGEAYLSIFTWLFHQTAASGEVYW